MFVCVYRTYTYALLFYIVKVFVCEGFNSGKFMLFQAFPFFSVFLFVCLQLLAFCCSPLFYCYLYFGQMLTFCFPLFFLVLLVCNCVSVYILFVLGFWNVIVIYVFFSFYMLEQTKRYTIFSYIEDHMSYFYCIIWFLPRPLLNPSKHFIWH